MYEKGHWPDGFTKVLIVTLQKKMNAAECTDHRTMSLNPHASKIMLKALKRVKFDLREDANKGSRLYISIYAEMMMIEAVDPMVLRRKDRSPCGW